MFQYGLQRLGIASARLTFKRTTFALVTDEKIEFESAFLLKIIQFATHLAKDVSRKALIHSTFVTVQIAL